MKTRVIIFIWSITAIAVGGVSGQRWIGDVWSLDTAITIKQSAQSLDYARLRYTVNDGVFYFIEATAFQHSLAEGSVTLNTLSLYDYSQREIKIPVPAAMRKESIVRQFWINDFHITTQKLVMSVQNQILVYNITEEGDVVYDTAVEHPNVKMVYLHRGDLYYLEEDHDKGYRWYRRAGIMGEEEQIAELEYEAPHLVQVNPNRYLFRDDNHLYFLSTRFAEVRQYTLDGRWEKDIVFELDHWKPFETEYIEKTLSVPYGIERIHATMADIFSFSYPKYVFPISGTMVMYLAQYDTTTGKSALQYVVLDSAGRMATYGSKDTSDGVYMGGRFPFNLFHPMEDRGRLTWNDLLIEITADSGISWEGLTPSEHQDKKERFFKRNEPIHKIRIMRYKNTCDKVCTPFFVDEDMHLHALNDLPAEKTVFLVNNTLECSACRNVLLDMLNEADTSTIRIGILQSFIPGALQEREIHRSIRQILRRDYQLYYLAVARFPHYPSQILQSETSYPALLFYEPGKVPICFSTDQIFDDDPYTYRYRDTFMDFLNGFFDKE